MFVHVIVRNLATALFALWAASQVNRGRNGRKRLSEGVKPTLPK